MFERNQRTRVRPKREARTRINPPCTLLLVAVISCVAVLATSAQPASAFPGTNGAIAFVSQRSGHFQIYTMQPDTTSQTQITFGATDNLEPSWSPDGNRIAFIGVGNGFDQVFVMNADGTGSTQLTTDSSNDDWPTWSADGQHIAFVKNFGTSSSGIWTMNADGTGQTQLTSSGDADPAWSPDGTKIAFSSTRLGNDAIFVMNADGTGITRIATGSCGMDQPSWSPDGTQIAFRCWSPSSTGAQAAILVVGSDGSNMRQLTPVGTYAGPTWSPDGTKILFWDASQNLFEVGPDGVGLSQLTTDAQGYAQPSWQPLPSADVALGLTVGSMKAKGKTTLTYTITVSNTGPSWANGVVITDQIPAGTVFDSTSTSTGSCQGPAAGSTGTVSCSVGPLASGGGATAQLIVRVTLKGKGSITDTATATATTPDPNTANNTQTVTSAT